jgi:hypothetical protein
MKSIMAKSRTVRGKGSSVAIRISQAAYQHAASKVEAIQEEAAKKVGMPVRVSVSNVVERLIFEK